MGLLATPGAGAAAVAPAGPFTAGGELALGKGVFGVRCRTHFAGDIGAADDFTVTAVRFEGGPACRRLSARGLPWRGRVANGNELLIEGLQVDVRSFLAGGSCGPAAVRAVFEADASAVRIAAAALPPDCRLEGRLLTTPRLVLEP